MRQLKFTVIIPTRERINTLKWSIKTLTEQQYGNLEIIISDNCSQDGTGEYVKSLNDNRIKYINTGKRVSMTENWEFALTHATGDFVTFIGDDDGLALGSLNRCNEILNEHNSKALVWKKANYVWSNHSVKYLSNTVELPTSKEVAQMNAMEEMEEILTFRKHNDNLLPAYFLPCLYNSFIRKDILDLAKAKQGGQFFHSRYPDIYSSILLPFFIDNYIYSFIPIGVNGASAFSNGNGPILLTQQKEHAEMERFKKETTIELHPRLKFSDYASIPFIMMESYLQVCDALKIESKFFNLNCLRDKAIDYAKKYTSPTLPWTLKSLEETYKVNGLTFSFDQEVVKQPSIGKKLKAGIKNFLLSLLRVNKRVYVFYLNTYRKKDFSIIQSPYPNNILGACQFAGEKLGYIKNHKNPISK